MQVMNTKLMKEYNKNPGDEGLIDERIKQKPR